MTSPGAVSTLRGVALAARKARSWRKGCTLNGAQLEQKRGLMKEEGKRSASEHVAGENALTAHAARIQEKPRFCCLGGCLRQRCRKKNRALNTAAGQRGIPRLRGWPCPPQWAYAKVPGHTLKKAIAVTLGQVCSSSDWPPSPFYGTGPKNAEEHVLSAAQNITESHSRVEKLFFWTKCVLFRRMHCFTRVLTLKVYMQHVSPLAYGPAGPRP